jgi:hypothetical protein
VGGGGSFSSCTTCVKFRWDPATRTFRPVSDTWDSSTQNACPADPNHDSVGVYLQVQHPAVTGLVFNSITIREHTVMSLEPMPSTSACKP